MFQMNTEYRSITAVCVVEDATKCPLGYSPISRTQDSDTEADLWKDGFFGKRVTRYVCTSRSQGRPEHVITSIMIINERELPPEGFSVIQNTVDSNQKSFQKKQLCFKLAHFRTNVESVTDIVILSKVKPPMGYDHIGEINGMQFCVKKISAITRHQQQQAARMPGMMPGFGQPLYPLIPSSDLTNSNTNGNGLGGYVTSPDRSSNVPNATSPPAQYPPAPAAINRGPVPYSSATLCSISELDRIPLSLREDLIPRNGNYQQMKTRAPLFPIKSEAELEREYSYDFRTEREVLIGDS